MTRSFRPGGFLNTQWPCLQDCYFPMGFHPPVGSPVTFCNLSIIALHAIPKASRVSHLHRFIPSTPFTWPQGMWPPRPAGGKADTSLRGGVGGWGGCPIPPLPRPTRQTGSTFPQGTQLNNISCLPAFEVGSRLLVLAH